MQKQRNSNNSLKISCVASSADGDFVGLDEVVVFESGSMNGAMECVNVTLNRDDLVEFEGEFTVELTLNSSKDSLSLGNNVTVVTLVDSDGMQE